MRKLLKEHVIKYERSQRKYKVVDRSLKNKHCCKKGKMEMYPILAVRLILLSS